MKVLKIRAHLIKDVRIPQRLYQPTGASPPFEEGAKDGRRRKKMPYIISARGVLSNRYPAKIIMIINNI